MKSQALTALMVLAIVPVFSSAQTEVAPAATEVAPANPEAAPAVADGEPEAPKQKKYTKEGFYLRAFYVNNSIEGDFNDTIVLSASDLIVGVPALDDGSGWGLGLGSRFEGKRFGGGFDFSLQMSDHEQTSFPDNGATFWALDMAFLVDVKTIYGLRPYAKGGLGLNLLTVENAGVDSGGIIDTTYFGYSFFYELGVAYFIIPSCSVNAGFGHRSTTFTSVEGHEIKDNLKGSGGNYTFGVSYVF